MTYYPVIIPTLNRYQHFKACVESLSACTHAEKTELIIGLDYPPSEKYVQGWKKIKEYVKSIQGFKKVIVFEHSHNLGSVGNWKFLANYIKQHYDAWIESEDDNVFSPCFLDYMNKVLNKYKNYTNILAVSAYMDPVNFTVPRQNKSNVLRTQFYFAWGLGKWRRTDEILDKSMPVHYMQYVCSHRKVLRKMRNNLRDLYQLIFWTKYNPKLDIRCDFTISCFCVINNMYVINPMLSLVRNMGHDGSGEHCVDLKNDYFSNQKISEKTVFDINDSLSENQNKELIAEWENFKTIDFLDEHRKLALKCYYIYMIFGYRLGTFIIDFKDNLKSILRPFYHKIKKIFQKSKSDK